MNKQQVLAELAEEFRTNTHLRHRLGIEDGMEVTPISETSDGAPVGLSWADKEGTDVAVQIFTSADDYGPFGG